MKKFFSLLLAIIMCSAVTAFPISTGAVMNKNDPKYFTSVTVNGEADDEEAVSIGALLNDGYYYSSLEKQYMDTEYKNTRLDELFVLFDEPGDYFQINFSSNNKKMITRLDVWVKGLDTIDEYVIQCKSYGQEWYDLCSGSLKKGFSESEIRENSDLAYCYPIVFDTPIPAVAFLRFVVKSYGKSGSALISEVSVAQDKTSGNFMERELLWTTLNKNVKGAFTANNRPRFYGTNKQATPFLNGFYMSGDTENYSSSTFAQAGGWPTTSYTEIVPKLIPNENGECFWAVDMLPVKQKPNHFSFNVSQGLIKDYEILYTNDTGAFTDAYSEKWISAGRATGAFRGLTEISLYDVPDARYWMLRVNEYEGDLHIDYVDVYILTGDGLDPVSVAARKALLETTEEKVVTKAMNFPASIVVKDIEYTLEWTSDSENIDVSTGEVILLDEEQNVNITLKTWPTNNSDNVRIMSKSFVLSYIDTRLKSVIAESGFENEEDSFDTIEGDIELADGKALFSGTGKGILNLGLENGFYYCGEAFVDVLLDPSAENASISVLSGEETLLTLYTQDGRLKADCEKGGDDFELSIPEGIRIQLFENGEFTLSEKIGDAYSVCIYKGKLYSDSVPDAITVETEDGTLSLDSLTVSVLSDKLLSEVEKQLIFDKLSQCTTADVQENLGLVFKVCDVEIEYESDSEVIDTQTGAVDSTNRTVASLTAKGSNQSGSFEKSFDVIVGGENLFKGAEVTGSIAADGSMPVSVVSDGKIETGFTATPAKTWNINMDLGEEKYFNELIFYCTDSENPINKLSVEVSRDDSDYTEIYSTAEIKNGNVIPVEITKARFIRVKAEQDKDTENGLREVLGYLTLSDKAICENDLAIITKDFDPEKGGTIPKTGTFGSNVTVTSDCDAITVTDSGENRTVMVNEPSDETNVNFEIKTSYNEESAVYTKKIVFLGTGEDFRENTIPSGGSSGGGGKKPSDSFVPTGNTAGQVQVIVDPYPELSSHWAEKEVRKLIERKIVQGDGNGLQLDKNVTRAEFMKMIMSSFNIEAETYEGGFDDVSETDWYASVARAGLDSGIMQGSDGKFRGNDPISRQEMCVTVIRALEKYSSLPPEKESVSFTDLESIDSWAKDGVLSASGYGIIKGYPGGEFMPAKTLSRAESMVVIYRVLEKAQAAQTEVTE